MLFIFPFHSHSFFSLNFVTKIWNYIFKVTKNEKFWSRNYTISTTSRKHTKGLGLKIVHTWRRTLSQQSTKKKINILSLWKVLGTNTLEWNEMKWNVKSNKMKCLHSNWNWISIWSYIEMITWPSASILFHSKFVRFKAYKSENTLVLNIQHKKLMSVHFPNFEIVNTTKLTIWMTPESVRETKQRERTFEGVLPVVGCILLQRQSCTFPTTQHTYVDFVVHTRLCVMRL